MIKTRSLKDLRSLSVLCWAIWTLGPQASAQTPPVLNLQMYAGVTVTGAVGTVYSIEYVTDLAQTNQRDWRCLEYLHLPASPYLWTDKSAPATGQRFYRAAVFATPTNMVFIPPGTFRMGSPTNEVDRMDWEGPQTAVTISRGWTSTRFSYGDDPVYTNLTDYAWHWDNSGETPHPVGQKSPNPWGLHDMHGNVWERCQDWYGDYAGEIALDPQGPATGSSRVIRGGGWNVNARGCRSARRGTCGPDYSYTFIGFRVVLAPGQP